MFLVLFVLNGPLCKSLDVVYIHSLVRYEHVFYLPHGESWLQHLLTAVYTEVVFTWRLLRIFPKYLTEPEIEKMNLTSETPVSED